MFLLFYQLVLYDTLTSNTIFCMLNFIYYCFGGSRSTLNQDLEISAVVRMSDSREQSPDWLRTFQVSKSNQFSPYFE